MTITDIQICIPMAPGAEEARDAILERAIGPLDAVGAKFKSVGFGTFFDGATTVVPETPFMEMVLEAGKTMGHIPVLLITFCVEDFDATKAVIRETFKDTAFENAFEMARWVENKADESDEFEPWKSLEIYYDIKAIPEGYEHPLDFRNEAMELIETALAEAEAGEWFGAESGMGEVNFGFEVHDFETAESIIRNAVAGTPYDCIREISRLDSAKDLPGGAYVN